MMTINKAKKKAKKYASLYDEAMSSLSCGRNLGEFISSSAREYRKKYEAAMQWLRENDPNFPHKRYSDA